MIKKVVYVVGGMITIVSMLLAFYAIGMISIIDMNNSEYIKENILESNSIEQYGRVIFENQDEITKAASNPVKIIGNGIKHVILPNELSGWISLFFLLLVIIGLIKLWIYIYLYKDYIPLYLQRGGRVIDEKGTHGTATWLNEKKIKFYLSRKYIALEDGIPLGTISSPEGKSIGKIRKEIVTTSDNPRFNDNIIAYAPPGEGKTFSFVFTTILNLLYSTAKFRPSFILNDSKGDVYKKIGKYLRAVQGYNTYLFNLLSPLNSDRINVLDWIETEKDAMVVVDLILKNTKIDQDLKGGGDPFWADGEEAIFTSVILLYKFVYKVPVNMAMVYDFFTQNSWEEIDKIMQSIGQNTPCRRIYSNFLKVEAKIRGNIVFGLTIRLKLFALDEIREVTSRTDIDIYKLKTAETALFFCIPDTNSAMNYLVAVTKAMIAEKMIAYIDKSSDKMVLERKIVQIDDEIANTGRIPQYSEWINTFRSRRWILIPIFQNLKQTEEMFGEQWMKVYGACHTKIFIGVNDPETAKFVSDELGIQSIRVMTKMKNAGIGKMLNDERWNQSDQKRNLMNPDEIRNLDIDRQIVIRRGCDPMLLYKVGWDNFAKDYKKAISMPESVYDYKKNSKNEKKYPDSTKAEIVMDFSSKNIERKMNESIDKTMDLTELEDGTFN